MPARFALGLVDRADERPGVADDPEGKTNHETEKAGDEAPGHGGGLHGSGSTGGRNERTKTMAVWSVRNSVGMIRLASRRSLSSSRAVSQDDRISVKEPGALAVSALGARALASERLRRFRPLARLLRVGISGAPVELRRPVTGPRVDLAHRYRPNRPEAGPSPAQSRQVPCFRELG